MIWKFLALLSAISGAMTGFIAARRWYQASEVEPQIENKICGDDDREATRYLANWQAMKEAARFNKAAARWTAATVVLTTLATIFGII